MFLFGFVLLLKTDLYKVERTSSTIYINNLNLYLLVCQQEDNLTQNLLISLKQTEKQNKKTQFSKPSSSYCLDSSITFRMFASHVFISNVSLNINLCNSEQRRFDCYDDSVCSLRSVYTTSCHNTYDCFMVLDGFNDKENVGKSSWTIRQCPNTSLISFYVTVTDSLESLAWVVKFKLIL